MLITGDDIVSLIDVAGGDSIKIYSSAAILLIVIACAVVLVTFFGCCGAWKENRCMLGTYFTAILVLFICILVGAVIAVTQDFDGVEGALKDTMNKYGNTDNEEEKAITEAWNNIQADVSRSLTILDLNPHQVKSAKLNRAINCNEAIILINLQ